MSQGHDRPDEGEAGREPPAGTDDMLTLLTHGELEIKGRLRWSSNATFLVAVRRPGRQGQPATRSRSGTAVPAIYKPAKGERPLWDFPRGLWRREVAAYHLDAHLGWGLVPPTVARADGPLGAGSVQYCVDAVLEEHYFTLLERPSYHDALRRIAAFDLVANNADRKGGHCLVDRDDHVWAIDNGLCFHVEPKLRTVAWDFAGQEIDGDLLAAIAPLARGEIPRGLGEFLSSEEVAALVARAKDVCSQRRYPEPSRDYPYPWPLI